MIKKFNVTDLLLALFECTVGDDENSAAEKMYKIAHGTLGGRDLIEPIRCKNCEFSRPLNRKDPIESRYISDCLWCEENNKGVLPTDYCSDAPEEEKQ